MKPAAHVVPLEGHVLDPDGPLLRDHVRKPDRRTDHYLDRYDRTTLYYDVVHVPDRDSFVFTAPRLLNLWTPFLNGLRLGGAPPSKIRRRKWLRCEQIEVWGAPGPMTLTLNGRTRGIVPRAGLSRRFAGKNALVAVNKNNALDWIRDWAAYYAAAHGAEAVTLFDNGSTDYRAQDIADTLAAVPGLSAVTVFEAPFPYGPTDRGNKLEISPRFFQTGMLNIARRDALAAARAVLSVDIDEIAEATTDARIFDLAVRHPLGMVSIGGSWVYPAPDTAGPAAHGAHVYRRAPNRKCNPKWCLRPDGVMSRFGWAVHQIGGILQNLFTQQSDVRLRHCHGTSTGWKKKRLALPDTLTRDPALERFMARWFPRA